MMTRFFILLLAMIFTLTACDKTFLGNEEKLISLQENLSVPPNLNDGWEVSSMDAEHIKPDGIKELVTSLQDDDRNIHSILIVKNNKLVLESYFGGWHRDRLQGLISCSKSVTSALIGIAIDKNKINNVHQKLFDFFPEYASLRTTEKDKIELQHVLTMSSGLEWKQSSNTTDDPDDDEYRLERSKDGFRYVLEKPMRSIAGNTFNYSSGNTDLLAGIIHHTTGQYADKFAEENLFKPLGIKDYGWRKQQNGHANAGYGLHLHTRDMAKIGQLFLDSGYWHGQQIISKQWIAESTMKRVSIDLNNGYGYQWWTRTWNINGHSINTYQAQGNGGQIICVVPGYKAVIILTGHNWGSPAGQLPYNFLQGYILPALL